MKGEIFPKDSVVSEINITPFVDVLLVLLILFMLAAPLLQSSIFIDLPQSNDATLSEENSSLPRFDA